MKEKINMDEFADKVAMSAIKRYDKEKKQEQKKKVFHNTRLLMKNYNDFKKHAEKGIDSAQDLIEDIDNLTSDEIFILSIRRSKIKTLIMIAHIDMAMESLKQNQIKSCTVEKYETLKMFYIDEVPYDEIVKHFNCGVNTPRRWINDMINELSILLFGIDGLKMDVV